MTTDQKIEALTSKYQALSERLDAIAARIESPASALAKLSHKVPTEKRQANSRANGAKGGRPKKHQPVWIETESGNIVLTNPQPRFVAVRDYSKSSKGRLVAKYPHSTEPWPTGVNKPAFDAAMKTSEEST